MKFNHLCFLAVFKNLFCNSPFGEIFLNLSLQFCLFWRDEGIQNWGWGQKRGWGPLEMCRGLVLAFCTAQFDVSNLPLGNSGCGILVHLDARSFSLAGSLPHWTLGSPYSSTSLSLILPGLLDVCGLTFFPQSLA